jgi:transposase
VVAISQSKIFAPMIFEEAMSQDVFDSYIKKVLAPELKENQTLMIDNLSSHKAAELLKHLNDKKVKPVFLQPQSPHSNTIEHAWSKTKNIMSESERP